MRAMVRRVASNQPHFTMFVVALATTISAIVLLNPRVNTFDAPAWRYIADLRYVNGRFHFDPTEEVWGGVILIIACGLWTSLYLICRVQDARDRDEHAPTVERAAFTITTVSWAASTSLWLGFAVGVFFAAPGGILNAWMIAGACASLWVFWRVQDIRDEGRGGGGH
jgi:hypothetical protein